MIKRIIDGKLFVHEDGKVLFSDKVSGEDKKQTIAIIIDTAISIPPTTGVTYRLYYLSKELVKRGHKIIWILGNRNFNSEDLLSELCDEEIKIHLLPLDLFYNAGYVSSILKEENVTVVQYEITQTFIELGIQVRALTKLPVLLEMHDIEATLRDTLHRKGESPLMKFLQYIAGEYADAVISMTPLDYHTLESVIGVQKEKLFLVPNGVAEGEIEVAVHKSDNTLLFLGNLFYPPNQNAFVYIAEEILSEINKDKKVILKSIGMIPDELRNKYSDRDDIVILGEIKDKQKFSKEVSSSTIGLCTVLAGSGMKIKILDYCLNGLPVVATSLGSSGYEDLESLIIADTKEEIINAINSLLEDKNKAENLSRQNRRRILELYGWSKIVEKFEVALALAASFDISNFKQEDFQPFWLEENRHKTRVLDSHFVIEGKKINKYGK